MKCATILLISFERFHECMTYTQTDVCVCVHVCMYIRTGMNGGGGGNDNFEQKMMYQSITLG